MKTNNKLHPVFDYLLDCIETEQENPSKLDKINFVLENFNSEANFLNNKKRYPNLQYRFAYWLQGAPSSISIEYWNDEIIKLAIKWGAIPENATENQQYKIISNYYNFMAAKFFQLCKQNKVDYSFLY